MPEFGLNRTHFAEFAEAVGVSTDDVMGAIQIEDSWGVLYTPDADRHPDSWIWFAHLRPDNRRILRVVSRRQVVTIREFDNDADELIRRGIG